jgi:hypothetical protein
MEGVLNDGCVSQQQVSDQQKEAQGECEMEEQEWPSHVVDSSHYNWPGLLRSPGDDDDLPWMYCIHAEALIYIYSYPASCWSPGLTISSCL